jgi:rhodanese-related sulfurtransferase
MLIKIPDLVSQIKQTVNLISAPEAVIKCQELSGVIVDVREPGEVTEKAATGTINIPRGVLEMKMLMLYPDANQAIFIHCASGVRAVFAAEQLNRLGYQNVWAITCAIDDVCRAFEDKIN